MKTLTTWILSAVAIAGWLAAASHFDHERERIAMEEEAAAIASRDFAARKVCGENAGFRWVDDTTLQCLTKRGNKTGKVASL